MSKLWCWIVASSLVLSTVHSRANEPPRVGVSAPEPDNPSKARLMDELAAQGYEVKDVATEAIDFTLREDGFSATMVVLERRILVRVARRTGADFEHREAAIDIGQTDEERATAAMRAVEFLRASLISVGAVMPSAPISPPSVDPEVVAPPPPPAPPPTTPTYGQEHAVVFGLGGGMIHSTGGTDSNITFNSALGFGVGSAAGIRLSVAVPVTSATIEGPEGTASLKPTRFGLSGWWAPVRSKWAMPYLEGGMGLLFVSITARPVNGYQAADKTTISGLPYVGAGICLLPGRSQLRLGVTTGPGLNREHVRFAEREVAQWGTWVTEASAMVEVGFE